MKSAQKPKIALALAGGGPLGAVYEIGALLALEEALDGLDLNAFDVYVGVSAGSFLNAALVNQFKPLEIYQRFIDNESASTRRGAIKPELFLKPALREYWRRAMSVPGLLIKGGLRYLAAPLRRTPVEAFAALSQATPVGIFDNEAIARFLQKTFSEPGRTDDFRRLPHKLFAVAVDLDTGKAIPFGSKGLDHVPISKAVQASAALPGLFPPVEIDGHFYVDGVLKKTVHASLAFEEGAELVICINPLVPFDADAAAANPRRRMKKLIEGGLPVVLSQTFRTLIHSRMHVGLEKYADKYPKARLVLFEPSCDDAEMFFTNLFSYSARKRVCEHAYQHTRRDLLKRREELEPLFVQYGIRLNIEALQDSSRTLQDKVASLSRQRQMGKAQVDLSEALGKLQGFVERSRKTSINQKI